MTKYLKEEIEDYIYELPHSATGSGRELDVKSKEARIKYGVQHAWSFDEVLKIASHFYEKGRSAGLNEASYDHDRELGRL